ncbi:MULTISPECIES: hypothetical protein [Burkholderia cepacia complex]|uniref:hypothetical protein n=1 Tax=Burkholderia cepacia complex TaxID=87882 RepID=UPI00088259A7|nr:hypothetical protein [Burkholderia cenocepacia]SDR54632.1 hypothetical protein SAMN05443026_5822 [Burkholderia orbicola]AQQ34565.1 hypothetical protein A8E96_20320 [Burkholderia cenocepacia]MBR8076084.1 hypothetical protein [Burkholderia cenocepacia]MBR8507412.1 hypothetical protein [Burkholderia cenocepacia]ONW33856.1 hypothetical protein A8E95_11625 [Burkholderia cenocepacia]
MSEAPKRAVQFEAVIQADTPQNLADALTDMAALIAAGEMPVRSIGGGVYTTHDCTLVVSEHPTHEEYVELLQDYLQHTDGQS